MYSFYLDNMQLPITPSKLQIKTPSQNKTMNLINDGEINILKLPGLKEISFEAIIPRVQYPFGAKLQSANLFLNKLWELKNKKHYFSFTVSRLTPGGKALFMDDISLLVSLESYSMIEDAQNGLDLLVGIELKEYKKFTPKIATFTETDGGEVLVTTENTRESRKEPAKTYTVQSGDTLWAICKKELGDGGKYVEIAKLNQISNPNLIYPGQVVELG